MAFLGQTDPIWIHKFCKSDRGWMPCLDNRIGLIFNGSCVAMLRSMACFRIIISFRNACFWTMFAAKVRRKSKSDLARHHFPVNTSSNKTQSTNRLKTARGNEKPKFWPNNRPIIYHQFHIRMQTQNPHLLCRLSVDTKSNPFSNNPTNATEPCM